MVHTSFVPKRKITPELWADILTAYDAWTPGDDTAPTIEELLRPFGISKQAFYAERRRVGLAPKAENRPATIGNDSDTVTVLLEALVEARLKIRSLEQELQTFR
jgi:hypothetical protein